MLFLVEKTRVKLTALENALGSDFISANFVSVSTTKFLDLLKFYSQGEVPGSERAYIATQGPLQSTGIVFVYIPLSSLRSFTRYKGNDFWRMIWEYNSMVIVMLANEVENGKVQVATSTSSTCFDIDVDISISRRKYFRIGQKRALFNLVI